MKKIFSIKTKILLVVSIIITIVGLITALLVFSRISNVLIKNKEEAIKELTLEQTGESSQYFENSQQFVSLLASRNIIRDYLINPRIDKTEIVQAFDEYQIENPRYLAIYLLNKKGTAIISSDRTFLNKDYSFREYFKGAITGKPITTALLGVTSNQFGYYFSHPVMSSDKKNVLGVVVAKLNNKEIDKIFANSELSKSGTVMLVDSMGVVMYSQKNGRFLNSLGSLADEETKLIKNENRYGINSIKSLGYSEIKKSINEKHEDIKIFKMFDKVDNEEEIIYLNRIERTSFYITVEVNYREIQKEAYLTTVIISLGVMSAAILSLLIISLFTIKILSPLDKISIFTEKINKDNFSERINIKTNDEFEKLSILLNKMLDNIEDLYKNLEKKVEEKTKDLEKFQLAVANASDHIVITDAEGIVIYANLAVERITGFKIKDIIGKKAGSSQLWGGLMSKDVYEKFWNDIKYEKKIFVGEFNNRRANGENYIAEAHVSPILDNKKQVQFFVGIERDVTRAKDVDRMKTEFISLASHQLRTPLSAMKWFTEMLLAGDMGKLNKEQIDAIDNIEQSNERMINLVNSLLNISRIESGRIIIDPKPTNIEDLAKDVIKSLNNKIIEKKIALAISVHPNLPMINLDAKLIREVFTNLLTNAIKYTPNEGEINVFISKKDNYIISQIQDSGYGIPINQQSKIFTKFFRADNAVKHETDGNGLGLYLIKSIIESSQGNIWFISEENKGTTFWFSLPISGMIAKEGQISIN